MNHLTQRLKAPPLDTIEWLNSTPLTLEQLKGKIVVIHAFQMLCPGCIQHGLPQANTIYHLYSKEDVQVIGLHTVFEHHQVMTSEALKAFVHEYRLAFPIAIDRPSDSGSIPHTMANYQMNGTPTLIILDKIGRVRLNHFGRLSDMEVGNMIGRLIEETYNTPGPAEHSENSNSSSSQNCGEDGCPVPT